MGNAGVRQRAGAGAERRRPEEISKECRLGEFFGDPIGFGYLGRHH